MGDYLGVPETHVSSFSGSTGCCTSAALAMSCWCYLQPGDTSNQELHIKKRGKREKKKKGKRDCCCLVSWRSGCQCCCIRGMTQAVQVMLRSCWGSPVNNSWPLEKKIKVKRCWWQNIAAWQCDAVTSQCHPSAHSVIYIKAPQVCWRVWCYWKSWPWSHHLMI